MPLVSASWRSVVAATPPTPPVLQVTPLGGNGWFVPGQSPLVVQVPPVIEHVPRGGHSLASVAPLVLQVKTPLLLTAQSQDWPLMLQ